MPLAFGGKLRERAKDKVPLGRARMGQGQIRIVQDNPVEVDEIDVDRPRSVAHRADSSQRILDPMHPAREVPQYAGKPRTEDL